MLIAVSYCTAWPSSSTGTLDKDIDGVVFAVWQSEQYQ